MRRSHSAKGKTFGTCFHLLSYSCPPEVGVLVLKSMFLCSQSRICIYILLFFVSWVCVLLPWFTHQHFHVGCLGTMQQEKHSQSGCGICSFGLWSLYSTSIFVRLPVRVILWTDFSRLWRNKPCTYTLLSVIDEASCCSHSPEEDFPAGCCPPGADGFSHWALWPTGMLLGSLVRMMNYFHFTFLFLAPGGILCRSEISVLFSALFCRGPMFPKGVAVMWVAARRAAQSAPSGTWMTRSDCGQIPIRPHLNLKCSFCTCPFRSGPSTLWEWVPNLNSSWSSTFPLNSSFPFGSQCFPHSHVSLISLPSCCYLQPHCFDFHVTDVLFNGYLQLKGMGIQLCWWDRNRTTLSLLHPGMKGTTKLAEKQMV